MESDLNLKLLIRLSDLNVADVLRSSVDDTSELKRGSFDRNVVVDKRRSEVEGRLDSDVLLLTLGSMLRQSCKSRLATFSISEICDVVKRFWPGSVSEICKVVK